MIMTNSIFCRYKAVAPYISSSGYLYDPYLCDKTYPIWYWKRAIYNAGFVLEAVINTGLATMKNDTKGSKLTHFICQKTSVVTNEGIHHRAESKLMDKLQIQVSE